MFFPSVIDVEHIPGHERQYDGWLIWLPGDFWEPYYGAYFIYSSPVEDSTLLW